MWARVWLCVKPKNEPRALASQIGARSPPKYGWNNKPSAPAGIFEAISVKRSYESTPNNSAVDFSESNMLSRAQRKTSPPLLTGPPTTQWSLSKAYVNVRPFGSIFGASVTTRIAPDVPIVTAATPG